MNCTTPQPALGVCGTQLSLKRSNQCLAIVPRQPATWVPFSVVLFSRLALQSEANLIALHRRAWTSKQ